MKKFVFACFVCIMMLQIVFAQAVFAGNLEQIGDNFYYKKDNGTHAINEWVTIDIKNDGNVAEYYFNEEGKLLANAVTPDGYKVNELGQKVGIVDRNIINNDVKVKTQQEILHINSSDIGNGQSSVIGGENVGSGEMSTSFARGHIENNGEDIYYIEPDGKMAKSKWELIDMDGNGQKSYYYFDDAGKLLRNAITPDGYKVDGNGRYITNNENVLIEGDSRQLVEEMVSPDNADAVKSSVSKGYIVSSNVSTEKGKSKFIEPEAMQRKIMEIEDRNKMIVVPLSRQSIMNYFIREKYAKEDIEDALSKVAIDWNKYAKVYVKIYKGQSLDDEKIKEMMGWAKFTSEEIENAITTYTTLDESKVYIDPYSYKGMSGEGRRESLDTEGVSKSRMKEVLVFMEIF